MSSISSLSPRNAPLLPVLVITSAIEAFAALTFLPKYLPENPFIYVFIRLIGFNFFLYVVYLIEIWPRLLSPLLHLPRPKGAWPLLGHGLAFFSRPPGSDFLRWVKEVPNDGLIHFRGFFNQDRLLVTNPKALQEILVTHPYDFEKPTQLRSFLRRILGDGLIVEEGEAHKFQRKNVMPVFNFRNLKKLYPMMWAKAEDLVRLIATEVRDQSDNAGRKTPEGVVEVNHWANKATMDIIGVAALGREFHAMQNDDDELVKTYEEILEPTMEKLLYFASQLFGPQKLINRLPWGLNERVRVTTGTLRRICIQLVQEKRQAVKKDPEANVDLLSVLVKSDNFSNDQLADQMLTFLAAGHETTSSAFTWTTYNLARNYKWQDKLREELKNAIPADKPPQSADELTELLEGLPVLNGVCEETIRMYPTVPVTIRDVMRNTMLVGQPIPAGTQIVICPWAVNRNPQLWSDPDTFKPDRWIDEEGRPNKNGGATSNYSIMTFLHGPRSCIGQGFAKEELRCLVALFTLAFEWEMADPNEAVQVSGVITTKPMNGMKLRLKVIRQM